MNKFSKALLVSSLLIGLSPFAVIADDTAILPADDALPMTAPVTDPATDPAIAPTTDVKKTAKPKAKKVTKKTTTTTTAPVAPTGKIVPVALDFNDPKTAKFINY